MALSPRLIRRRIRSVANTKKITKAMELVAAAKMRRAVAAALKTRAYAKLAWGMVESLEGSADEVAHPLLRGTSPMSLRGARDPSTRLGTGSAIPAKHAGVLYVVMASDRGLCGGFNAALFRELVHEVRKNDTRYHSEKIPGIIFIAIGKKAEQFIRRQGWNLVASFTNIAVAPTVAELRPIAKLAMDTFTSGEVREVRIAFTDFVSSLRQHPLVRTLLPLQKIEEIGIGPARHSEGAQATEESHTMASAGNGVRSLGSGLGMTMGGKEFLFEPSPATVLSQMLPRVVELQTYQMYLETGASEHSARMLAMRSASDSAGEMIDDLTLTFNQARQSLITREIAEISAGSAALQS